MMISIYPIGMIPATLIYTACNLCIKNFSKQNQGTEVPETNLATCCNETL